MSETDAAPVTRPDLAKLSRRINVAHGRAEAGLRPWLSHARAAGEALLEARAQLPGRRWLAWLRANVRCTPAAARAYMRVAGAAEQAPAVEEGPAPKRKRKPK